MKKLYFLFILSLSVTALSAQAPSYVDFEWDIITLGYSFGIGDNSKVGNSGGTEVRYNATDRFAVGLGFAGYNITEEIDDDLGISTGSSYLVGEYYLKGDSGQRPFVGLATGLSFQGLTYRSGDRAGDEEVTTSSYFAPRVGYEFGHVRLSAQYAFIPQATHNNYFNLSVGITLWGGYKGQEYR